MLRRGLRKAVQIVGKARLGKREGATFQECGTWRRKCLKERRPIWQHNSHVDLVCQVSSKRDANGNTASYLGVADIGPLL